VPGVAGMEFRAKEVPIVSFAFINAHPRLARLLRVSFGACALGLLGGSMPGGAEAAPFVKQGAPLLPTKPSCGRGSTGGLSGDGNTALVGGPGCGKEEGAAWVFVRKGSTWSQQAELRPAEPKAEVRFGSDVVLSHDGSTAIIGGQEHAWIFTRSGSTWTQQGPQLTSGQGEGCAGVGLSYDGNTAVLGGCISTAYFFGRSGTTWTEQGPVVAIKGQEEELASRNGLDLSGDGNTAVVTGGVYANFVVRSGSAWHLQQVSNIGRLTCRECAAVSSDGSTVLAGSGTVLVRIGSKWSVQKLLEPKERMHEERVWGEALSGDGNTVLLDTSGHGVVVFNRYGSTWAEQEVISGTSTNEEVTLSADATTALVAELAGVQPYVRTGPPPPPPIISGVSPRKGRATGGTAVSITGTSFTGATAVKFGSTNAPSFTVNSATSITAKSPPATKGIVDITVTTPNGTSPVVRSDRFTYTH
jgi:hypothetical protein